jgi:hypothetical protein
MECAAHSRRSSSSKARDIEAAATRAHIDLGIVTSRSNAEGVQAVQWSLPG